MQHVQIAPLDGELQVLHVLVVDLEHDAHGLELFVDLGHEVLEFAEEDRRAHPGHHIFTLGVDQHVTVEDGLAGARVAREAHPRATVLAHVAEDHLADVDGCTVQVGDLLNSPISDRSLTHPAIKHRVD